jgi:2-oxoglutarate ferredoxin oxidoreductase subunit alpha
MGAVATKTEHSGQTAGSDVRVNDITIKVATPNGSGSQSANLILMHAFFGMGIPVSGKNLFPSNIQGLPTWFSIRVNEEGWQAQKNHIDLFVSMNSDTTSEDVAALEPGAMLVIDKVLAPMVQRDDLTVYAVPFQDLVKDACDVARLRKMVVNIIYVGVIASVLGIELNSVHKAVDWQFASKAKAAELNKGAVTVGYEWAQENLQKQSRFVIRPSDAAKDKIIIEGNDAAALGMMFGGVTTAAWYPITPSSSLCEYLQKYLDKYRRDPETGKATYAIVQAEDEIASMGVVLGAGWAGARAFTATSGPGISLMSEMAGLAYFAEIPAVIVDVQRMGPSTGLPTRVSQGDMLSAYNLSHGDCRHVLLIPGSVKECYELAMESLNLAERLQTLVLLMTDLDLGMNKWLSEPLEFPDKPLDRGKVLSAEDLETIEEFARYRDVDGDGIAYRTIPGTEHPDAAYFTRGTGHTDKAMYSEDEDNWKENMDRLARKFDTARELVPKPIVEKTDGAKATVVAYGSSDFAVQEARHELATQHDIHLDYIRLRALPLSKELQELLATYETIYMVEQNRDAQVALIIKADCPHLGARIHKVLHYNGLPLDAETVREQILSHAKQPDIA